MQTPEPKAEHRWLHQLIGVWSFESECQFGPDQPPMKTKGREVVRPLGSLWTIGEWSMGNEQGEFQDNGSCDSIMTLGYDPHKEQFIGSFISAAMTHLWPYHGSLDATGKILTLDSEGPSFAGDGTLAKYQDILEFVTRDHRILTSRVQSPDGSWNLFMTSHFRRQQ